LALTDSNRDHWSGHRLHQPVLTVRIDMPRTRWSRRRQLQATESNSAVIMQMVAFRTRHAPGAIAPTNLTEPRCRPDQSDWSASIAALGLHTTWCNVARCSCTTFAQVGTLQERHTVTRLASTQLQLSGAGRRQQFELEFFLKRAVQQRWHFRSARARRL